jgi:hypothetical protein
VEPEVEEEKKRSFISGKNLCVGNTHHYLYSNMIITIEFPEFLLVKNKKVFKV